MVATPSRLRAKKAITTPWGMSGAESAIDESSAAESATSPAKPPNHGIDWRAPRNSSAPSGEVSPQRQTAELFSKPPRLHWSRNGKTRLISSWLRRKRTNRRHFAKATMLAAEASW